VPVLQGFQADVHRWGGAHPQSKRFRQYGDLRLLDKELSPLGLGQTGWQVVDQLTPLSYQEWFTALEVKIFTGMRRVAMDALDGVIKAVRALVDLTNKQRHTHSPTFALTL